MADDFDDFYMELCTHTMRDLKQGHNCTANVTGHTVTGRTTHSLEDYKALLLSAADTFDEKHAAKRCPIHNPFYHNLDNSTVAYEYDGYGYNFDTDIVTVYANAAKTHASMVPTEQFHQIQLGLLFQMMMIVLFLNRIQLPP